VIFIRTKEPIEPVKLVHTLLTDLSEKKLKKTRFISRYLPVEKTCLSTLDDIETVAKTVMAPTFQQQDDQGNVVPKKVIK
jgi:tRNA acetyltransferase TAN1